MIEPDRADPLATEVAVIDDDPLFLDTLVGNLKEAGVSAMPLEGGQAALDYFTGGGRATALVLDWQMPDIDGPELLQRLRDKGLNIPALFLTGLTQPIYEERGLKLGAVDFIEKSKSFAVILQRVKLVISGYKTTGDMGGGTPPVEIYGPLELHHESARAVAHDGGAADAQRVQGRGFAGQPWRRRCTLPRDLRRGARRGLPRRFWRRGIPGQCSGTHQAHPAEVPAHRPRLRRPR